MEKNNHNESDQEEKRPMRGTWERKHTREVEGEIVVEGLMLEFSPHSLRARIVLLGAGLGAQHRVEGLALRKAGVF